MRRLPDLPASFTPATRQWFSETFPSPTPVQTRGWPIVAEGKHALLIAPTGSGKTLAAFLWCIDRLKQAPRAEGTGVRVLYISPLKALAYDVERNLAGPLAGIARTADLRGEAFVRPDVAMRTGDTASRDRQRMLRHPPDILVTTPESLYLMLTSQAREVLRSVETVIVDEVHALAPTKRGAHLSLTLERLAHACTRDPQRIGLSATATPLTEVARFLGGDRDVEIVDCSAPPDMELQIVVPVRDMTRPGQSSPAPLDLGSEPTTERVDNSIWPAVYPRLLELIAEHRSTIIFVNSRGLCERLSQRLNEIAGQEDLVRAHHGSVAREQREAIEEMLKAGAIKAIVATSSLELGIDMGAVDLVVMVESPGAVARGLQRVGRAGHGVGQTSRARIFPKHRGDLLESAVVAHHMQKGAIEAIIVPQNPLDVLAQHIVSMCAVTDWPLADLAPLVRRSANYRALPQDALIGVVDMLSGRYPSHAFADLRPRVTWDRQTDVLKARRGAAQVAIFNGGTIPDRGTYGVYLGVDGPRVGELDEEMVNETVAGQNIQLGATTWRVEQITKDRVLVSPAPGESGRLPFWRGDGPGRPPELGRAIGAFVRELDALPRDRAEALLEREYGLDRFAAENLLAYLGEQKAHTGTLPTDRRITIERFRDELGDWRICILSPFGVRVHAPWALALQAQLEAELGFEVQVMWTDDGIVLRLVEIDELPALDLLIPDAEAVEERLVEQLAHSALFAGQFRENAARALLLPRPRANARTPLWQQRLKSQQLLAVAREYPSFPIIIETYRACLQDIFDLPALVDILRAIESQRIRIDEVETASASPFARSLVFAYVAAYLYEGDAPLAERKAQALALDRRLLSELLGREEFRELLDGEVIRDLEDELQGRAEEFRARHVDAMHDLLRKVGDLTAAELEARCEPSGGAKTWCEQLVTERRALRLLVGGEQRYIAVEDAGLYRDALGSAPPPGVPKAFLGPVEGALAVLVQRYARTHGPFTTADVQARYGVGAARCEDVLLRLEAQDQLLRGEFRPGGTGSEWCDPEVLRRIKRRTLARLRGEIAPVEPQTLVRFLPHWHGIVERRSGLARLEETIVQLEGLPLSFRELESVILPARVQDYRPQLLDELGATGWLVWVGLGSLGKSDGRVALFRRERIAWLFDPPPLTTPLDASHEAILDYLRRRGACFSAEIQQACGEGAKIRDVREALWDLVWNGLVTNDTFVALRSYGHDTSARSVRRSPLRNNAVAGRWSLVTDLLQGKPTDTERALARASTLVDRHGVLAREVTALEPVSGGFSASYPVLREMEDRGKVRRGYFVDGLSGSQFASPGALDRLRAQRRPAPGANPEAVVLSAVDPANPFGWLLPWPERPGNTLRRVPGAKVILADGELALYLDASGKRLVSFDGLEQPGVREAALEALRTIAASKRGRTLRLELVDGVAARTAPLASALLDVGFKNDPRGLTLDL